MDQVRVLVVDDSAFMRKMISDILEKDPRITVVGTGRNGEDGIKKIKQLSPDVVTLDVEMPVMDGLTAVKWIMDEHPLPVVMLSSLTHDGAESTVMAMQYGAVDVIAKPSGPISLDIDKIQVEIINKVYQSSKANIKQITNNTPVSQSIIHIEQKHRSSKTQQLKKIVAIGTSTGGPRALQNVLTKLPADFPAPIVIVQHMPPGFTKSLADRLNSLSEITVKEAEDGELLQKGTAYIAPGNYHMSLRKVGLSLAVVLDQTETRNGHRPSVDVLFESLSTLDNYEKIGVIMTGMGADGSNGLVAIKSKSTHATFIAESSESAVVYGMPKAAVRTNLVDHEVHLDNISHMIIKSIGR